MKIQEIMTKDPATVTPGATVRDAAKLMQRENFLDREKQRLHHLARR